MTSNSQMGLSKPIHDIMALGAAVIATATTSVLSDWLQVVVLFLTVIFLGLGIALRVKKIKEDSSDDPSMD